MVDLLNFQQVHSRLTKVFILKMFLTQHCYVTICLNDKSQINSFIGTLSVP